MDHTTTGSATESFAQPYSATAPGSLVLDDTIAAPRGLLATLAGHPLVVAGATIAAALSAASYFALDRAIPPKLLYADQRPQYVFLALSAAVACLVAVGALIGSFLLPGPLPRVRLERTILIFAALSFELQACSALVMQFDFHAFGTFVPSEVDHVFQWTSALASVALFSALVIDAAIAADSRPAHEVWWRGAVGVAAMSMLVGSFIKLTAALTNIVFTHSDEVAIGVTGVIAGAMVAASATRPSWWWRIGVGTGLAVSGFGFVELGHVGVLTTLSPIGQDSLAIAVGYGVLALTGLGVLILWVSSTRTPRGPARYPD